MSANANGATEPFFRYSVRIINPEKPSQFITRLLHHFHGRFTSTTALKIHLMEKLGEHVPDTVQFNIGYFENKVSRKLWLCCEDDLTALYEHFKDGGEVTLWCDVRKSTPSDRNEQPGTSSQKRKQDTAAPSKRQEKEEEVDGIFAELKEKHGSKYEIPKLRLWARLIAGGVHDSCEDPPAVPAFQCGQPKRRRESFAGALTGAVEALVKYADKRPPEVAATSTTAQPSQSLTPMGVSPGKAADLRRKNLEQLRYLQGLYEDNILSDQELAEQKRIILDALRKL